jgi:hypothetical protein
MFPVVAPYPNIHKNVTGGFPRFAASLPELHVRWGTAFSR